MRIRPRKGRVLLRVLMALILLGILLEGILMLCVYISGAIPRPPKDADAIIVLGARVMPDGELSTTLEHRIETALQMYRQGHAKTVIVCGAQGGDEPKSEADAMAEFLIASGVPEAHILRDPDSTDTVQNIQNAMALMGRHGLQNAMVVTSDYHLTRSLWIARDQGLQATGVPAPGPDLWHNRLKANVRETLSWMNYYTGGLLGRLSGLSDSGE